MFSSSRARSTQKTRALVLVELTFLWGRREIEKKQTNKLIQNVIWVREKGYEKI